MLDLGEDGRGDFSGHIFDRIRQFPRLAGLWGNDKETRFKMEKGFDAIMRRAGRGILSEAR